MPTTIPTPAVTYKVKCLAYVYKEEIVVYGSNDKSLNFHNQLM